MTMLNENKEFNAINNYNEESFDLKYEYECRRRKVITRIISFAVVTLLSLIFIVDYQAPSWLEDIFTVPMALGGSIALLFGKMMEDGIGSFVAKLFGFVLSTIRFLLSMVKSILLVIFGGIIVAFIVLVLLTVVFSAISWFIETFFWLIFALCFVPFALSVIFTVLDIRFLKNNKETYYNNFNTK